MRKIKSILATVMVLTIILGMEGLAYSYESYYLPKNQIVELVCNKSTEHDYFAYRLYDVYPPSGEDTYTRIKLSATDKNGYTVVSTKVISESKTITTIPTLRDLDSGDYVLIQLRGNDPTLAAWVDIYLKQY